MSLDYSLARLEENRRELSRSLVEVVAAKQLLETRRGSLATKIMKYEEQTEVLLKAEREDLARTVLERKQEMQARLEKLESNLADVERQVEDLKQSKLNLDRKIDFFRSEKEELSTIYHSTRAQVRVREALTGISKDLADVGNAIQRIEERILSLRSRNDAIQNLVSEGLLRDVLEPETEEIDRQLSGMNRQQAVENELNRLKIERTVE